MSASWELIEAVRARAAETPYEVTETERGFDLDIEIVDAKWYSVMHKQGLRRAWKYQVELDEAEQVMRITDKPLEVKWKAGMSLADGTPIPTFQASKEVSAGRMHSKSFRKTYAINEQGRYDQVVNYRFDSAEGRDLIRDVAAELGWQERSGTAQRVGLVVAVAAVAFAVVLAVLLLVL